MLSINTKRFSLRVLLLSGCVLLMAWTTAYAQYQTQSWTTDDGLPQNTVHSIVQTRDGYLWMATLDGLVRYDGVRFTVFNKNNSQGIESNRFTQVIIDAHDDLWIMTESSGVTRYHKGRFQTYPVAADPPGKTIYNLALDNRDELIAFAEAGVFKWADGKFVPYEPVTGGTGGHLVLWSETGAFWYADRQAVHRSKDNRVSDYRLPGVTIDTAVTNLLEDTRGRLWIGTTDLGLFVLENEKLIPYGSKHGLSKKRITPQIEDRSGNLWVASGEGAVIISADDRITRLTTEQGLSDDALTSVYEDREGNIWIGSLYRGLNRLSRYSMAFYSKKDGLAGNVVHPIYEDREGVVWIGGVSLTRYEAGRFSAVPSRKNQPQPEQVTAIEQDRSGRLWFGHWFGVYYLENGKYTDFTQEFGLQATFTDIHEDRNGVLWFASNKGLFRWQHNVMTSITTAEGLVSNDVKVIHQSRDGTLWIGTYGGLTMYNPPANAGSSDSFKSFTIKDGLASNLVRSLYEDADGVLWIGSYDGGLTRSKNGQFTRYTTSDGLFNEGVFQILEDERGWFWMSSNRGIYRVAKGQLNDFAEGKTDRINSIAYSKADGLLETECNGGQQPAGIKARDGKLWFPTQRGVAVIDPNSIRTNPYPPPVLIESAKIDGEEAALGEPLEIAPGKNNLEIAYTGLSFVKPEFVKFRYKLEGLDADWVEAGDRRTAYYSYLPPGDYVFKVIAANSDSVWNTEGAELRVRVVPPFYRTWSFLLLSFALIGGVAFLFYRRRVTQLEKEKAVQQVYSRQLIESQEQERKRIAVELHDGLGQSLVVIKNRALIGLNTPENHDRLRSQMEEISEAASAAIVEVRGIARNLHPYQIEYLGLTTALRTMIESVADASHIALIYEIDALDGELSREAEINLYRIVQEALNNVVKHSAASAASVSLKINARVLELVIQDNGKGFAPQSENGNRGLGLTGIAERAKMLNARHEIRSAEGMGTTISLQITL